ncbi:hypothetical protein M23134_07000 [Microscilla marina ATCC 23134]|uniref:Uncharacterized protein n=1 Tax=Microscilla marina ATCC 23134 TaxID=313606 RepID=A1ZT15_MICM2|nr:hypothetical protein M23134_07000 [Microscilla marina ATCC 23134]
MTKVIYYELKKQGLAEKNISKIKNTTNIAIQGCRHSFCSSLKVILPELKEVLCVQIKVFEK